MGLMMQQLVSFIRTENIPRSILDCSSSTCVVESFSLIFGDAEIQFGMKPVFGTI